LLTFPTIKFTVPWVIRPERGFVRNRMPTMPTIGPAAKKKSPRPEPGSRQGKIREGESVESLERIEEWGGRSVLLAWSMRGYRHVALKKNPHRGASRSKSEGANHEEREKRREKHSRINKRSPVTRSTEFAFAKRNCPLR